MPISGKQGSDVADQGDQKAPFTGFEAEDEDDSKGFAPSTPPPDIGSAFVRLGYYLAGQDSGALRVGEFIASHVGMLQRRVAELEAELKDANEELDAR